MRDHEATWDKRLQIRTCGRDEENADQYRYPYEPTPYSVLERLAAAGMIGAGDTVLDYGCGMGRVDFFLAHQTKAHTIGVEYDQRIYRQAVENQKTALSRGRSSFVLGRAEAYPVPAEVNRCYFFNPFSVEILHKVLARLLDSWYGHPREICLFFYYPAEEYLSCLMAVDELEYLDEIPCGDLFEGKNPRERIAIFRLPALC